MAAEADEAGRVKKVKGLKSDMGGGGRGTRARETRSRREISCFVRAGETGEPGSRSDLCYHTNSLWCMDWRVPSFLSPLSPDIREERKSMQNENAEHTDEVGNDQAHLLFYDAWKESHHST